MRRCFALLLGSVVFLAACTKEVPVNRTHDFTAESSPVAEYSNVKVTLLADYSVNCSAGGLTADDMTAEPLLDCTVYSVGSLRIVTGECRDIVELVEASFWKETSALWIYFVNLDSRSSLLESMGFADCCRHFLSEEAESGHFVYAASNVFDLISGFIRQGDELSFNVRLKTEHGI